MMEGFYAVCEPHLTRRRFLTFAMVAGMVPALTAAGDAARDPDQAVRRFIERYAIGPMIRGPWCMPSVASGGTVASMGRARLVTCCAPVYGPRKSQATLSLYSCQDRSALQHVSQDLPRGGRPPPRCSRATVASFS